MRRHWQKKPLVVRGAIPGVAPPLPRAGLFELAASPDVESRLVVRDGGAWRLRHGPLPRRALPPLARPAWTLLVQGLDLHVDAARALIERFRFVPEARLDDLMVSYASDGGGVGPHVDSYDVFLIQVEGRRRWQYGFQHDLALVPGLPLKILQRFEAWHECVLEPGDMLYLPPGWAHDGVAVGGGCMTCSVGLRVPGRDEIARSVLQRALDEAEPRDGDVLYRDPRQPATDTPGRIPPSLAHFALDAVARLAHDRDGLECALGEVLTEPKPQVWFDPDDSAHLPPARGLRLDRRTRMLYDERRVYINGESYRAGGRDARAMHELADRRRLGAAPLARLSPAARELVAQWLQAGWVRVDHEEDVMTLPEIVRIASRSDFHAAVRSALSEAASAGWRELCLCDPNFADWPLNEAAVIESLTQWAGAQRSLTLLALDYDEVMRRHPRFVRWRIQWSHLVRARALQGVQGVDVPVLLHARGGLTLRLLDPVRYQGRVSRVASDITQTNELIDAISQRSIEAFPATVVGL